MMPTDSASRTLIGIALLAVLAWCVWLIRDVLPPFLISLGIALLFDPVIDRMEQRGVPRAVAVGLVFALVFGAGAALMVAVVPRAIGQVADLIRNIDAYGLRLQAFLDGWVHQNADLLRRAGLPPSVADIWRDHQAQILGYLQVGLQGVFQSLQGFAGALGWFLVIPIVTLYLMMDLDPLKARIHHACPPQHREWATSMSARVGQVFAAYLRGLTLICLAFGLVNYLVLGGMFQLQYAVILGLLAVVLYAIPYLGQLTLLVAAALIAWLSGRPPAYTLGVAVAVIVVGQLFDQVVTPRVMGKQVGLHPVLGVFALMVGGHLFGLIGMVLAVPVAAAVRVVLIEIFPRLGEPLPTLAERRKKTLSPGEEPPAAGPESVAEQLPHGPAS